MDIDSHMILFTFYPPLITIYIYPITRQSLVINRALGTDTCL